MTTLNSNIPKIAIIGRPNVGKSSIFNRLAHRRISIVHDYPGVTRDRLTIECESKSSIKYELMDTGGIGAILDDNLMSQVRLEADIAIDTADLILFVVNAREGISPIDKELSLFIRKTNTPVILLINKVDTQKNESDSYEFSQLGYDDFFAISASHGRNFDLLENGIDKFLSEKIKEKKFLPFNNENEKNKFVLKVSIVGRPNVGKSSLINAILNDTRNIVSDESGTTRDSVDVLYSYGNQNFLFIDTAGIRKRTKRDSSIEVFSVMRSERSIRRSDICLLVIDASSGIVSQDRRIAKTIIESKKPCIIILNKFDLYRPDEEFHERINKFKEELGDDLFFLPYAPKVAVSAQKKQFLGNIFTEINKIVKTSSKPIPTGILNKILHECIERNPPPVRMGKRLKILYSTQVRKDIIEPVSVPEYLLFINYSNLLTRTYERFLENEIRKQYPMEGLPFIFKLKPRMKRVLDNKGKRF